MQASATAEDDAAVAQNLALQAKMMATINRLQTTDMTGGRPGGSSSVPAHVPPPLPPNLFACPGTAQRPPALRCAPLTPRVLVWQTGSRWCRACARPRHGATWWTSCASCVHLLFNLLVRAPKLLAYPTPTHNQVNDHIAAALGVPASVIFEGARSAFEPSRVRLSRRVLAAQASSRATP